MQLHWAGNSGEAENPRHLTHVWGPGADCWLQHPIAHNMATLPPTASSRPSSSLHGDWIPRGTISKGQALMCQHLSLQLHCVWWYMIGHSKSHGQSQSQWRSWLLKGMDTGRHICWEPTIVTVCYTCEKDTFPQYRGWYERVKKKKKRTWFKAIIIFWEDDKEELYSSIKNKIKTRTVTGVA